MDWYAPIKWAPVLSVSKEVYISIVKNRVKSPASNPSNPSSTNYAYVSSDALNVRSGPSANYVVVGRLSQNTRVQVINKTGAWWKIKSGNIEGYVNSEYLRN
jgi:N-acetylmuramoyl-L-alanine amidase